VSAWYAVEFFILAFLSTWMTATILLALSSKRQREEDMNNLYEQVVGALRVGDLPRAVLMLEGETGPLAKLLASILNESTKYAPKLRVAYKVTLESLKRHSQISSVRLRVIAYLSLLVGILGFLGPLGAALLHKTPSWLLSFMLFIISLFIAGIAYLSLARVSKMEQEEVVQAGDLGRKLLNYLLSSESPLKFLRGDSFPT